MQQSSAYDNQQIRIRSTILYTAAARASCACDIVSGAIIKLHLRPRELDSPIKLFKQSQL